MNTRAAGGSKATGWKRFAAARLAVAATSVSALIMMWAALASRDRGATSDDTAAAVLLVQEPTAEAVTTYDATSSTESTDTAEAEDSSVSEATVAEEETTEDTAAVQEATTSNQSSATRTAPQTMTGGS